MTTFSIPPSRNRGSGQKSHAQHTLYRHFMFHNMSFHLNHSLTALRARTRPAKQGSHGFAHLLNMAHAGRTPPESNPLKIGPLAQSLPTFPPQSRHPNVRSEMTKVVCKPQCTHLDTCSRLCLQSGASRRYTFPKTCPRLQARHSVLRISHTPSRKSPLPSHRQSHVSESWASVQQTTTKENINSPASDESSKLILI